jgi:hypothetical protein
MTHRLSKGGAGVIIICTKQVRWRCLHAVREGKKSMLKTYIVSGKHTYLFVVNYAYSDMFRLYYESSSGYSTNHTIDTSSGSARFGIRKCALQLDVSILWFLE